jgi:cysteine desulfurase
MLPFFLETFANASSGIHAQGRAAAEAVEAARLEVAQAIGALAGEIVFTSGATESNNLAIQGAVRAAPKGRTKVLATAIEHKCVLETGKWLSKHGYEFELVPVMEDGTVDLSTLAEMVDERTILVSVQGASNEIGTIQPLPEVARLVHQVGALVHCDAAQVLGRIPADVEHWDVDLLSVSAHKCYGPKGVGALYVKGGGRSAAIDPLMFGGGQEAGLRSGTQNVPGIVGFGRACHIARDEMPAESRRVGQLRDDFEAALFTNLPGVFRNGPLTGRLSGNSSVRFDGVEAEALIANLPNLAISAGSACTSGAIEPSHVLVAIGLTREQAYSTIRVGMGRFTTNEEIDAAVHAICQAVTRLRRITGTN